MREKKKRRQRLERFTRNIADEGPSASAGWAAVFTQRRSLDTCDWSAAKCRSITLPTKYNIKSNWPIHHQIWEGWVVVLVAKRKCPLVREVMDWWMLHVVVDRWAAVVTYSNSLVGNSLWATNATRSWLTRCCSPALV